MNIPFLKKLSKRDRRTVTIGLTSVVAIVFVMYGLLPYLDASADIENRLQERSRQLSRTLSHLGNRESYRQQLEDVRAELSFYRAQLLDATDPNLARVELEGIVRGLAAQTGTEISRSTFLPVRNQDTRYGKLTLQITVRDELDNLTDFLYELSDHPKFLAVESLNVSGLRRRGEVTLQHRLNISAYARLLEQ